MPIYVMRCSTCNTQEEVFRSVAGRKDLYECRKCGRPMQLVGAPEPDIKPRKTVDVFRKV
jgi:putative FmdB family regulatory protein